MTFSIEAVFMFVLFSLVFIGLVGLIVFVLCSKIEAEADNLAEAMLENSSELLEYIQQLEARIKELQYYYSLSGTTKN